MSEVAILPVSFNASVSVSKMQISSEINGDAVILNLSSGAYYGLNEVGARIWELLQKNLSLQQIRMTLLDEYDVDAEQCDAELLGILQDLQAAGLIEVNP